MSKIDQYRNQIICGDCLEIMKELPDNSDAKQTMFFLPENGAMASGNKGKATLSSKKISEYQIEDIL